MTGTAEIGDSGAPHGGCLWVSPGPVVGAGAAAAAADVSSSARAFAQDGHVAVPSGENDSQRPQTMPISLTTGRGRAYYDCGRLAYQATKTYAAGFTRAA